MLYPQRWLKELQAKTSKIGWFKDTTYEVLKTQKSLEHEEIFVTSCHIVLPNNVKANESYPLEFKYLPRVATNLDYDITISDEDICYFDVETNSFIFNDVVGVVEITIDMKDGEASYTKTIQVDKNASFIKLTNGNCIVKDTPTILSLETVPLDSNEQILDVYILNTNDVVINTDVVDEIKTYEILAKKTGNYTIHVDTNVRKYSLPIYIVNDISNIVNSIQFENEGNYDFNSTIYINPLLTPSDAIYNSYNVIVENNDIAYWNSGKNALITKALKGSTNVTIKMTHGNAEYNFTLNVIDSSVHVGLEDVDIILPPNIKENEKMELNLILDPTNASADDLEITSTSEAIITKENGKWFIEGVTNGTATITVTSLINEFTKNFELTVVENIIYVDSIVANIPDVLTIDESTSFDVTVSPETAHNKNYIVTTSTNLNYTNLDGIDSIIATSIGQGWIRIKAEDDAGFEFYKELNVIPVNVSSITINGIDTSSDIFLGSTNEISIVVTPENATNKEISVTSSSNVRVTKLTDYSYSLENFGLGSAFVTVTANDGSSVSETINYNISPILVSAFTFNSLNENMLNASKQTFTVDINPENATDKTFTTTSSTNLTHTIDNNSIELTATNIGAGWVKVTANDGSGISLQRNITVDPILVNDFQITGITNNESINVGVEKQFNVTALPSNASNKTFTVTSTSGLSIQKVNDTTYKTTVLSDGSHKITITSETGYKKELNIVGKNVLVTDIMITNLNETMFVSDNQVINVSVLPTNATNKTLNITKHANMNVVNNNDGTYTITANAKGQLWFELTATDGSNITSRKTIQANSKLTEEIVVEDLPTTMNVGDNATYVTYTLPESAIDKTVTITTSSNLSNVLLSGNEYQVTANSDGDGWIKIVANDGGAEVTKNIIINPILVSNIDFNASKTDIYVNETTDIDIIISPSNAKNKGFTVETSSNITHVINDLKVSVTGVSVGAAFVRVIASDGSLVENMYTLNVLEEVPPIVEVTEISSTFPEMLTENEDIVFTVNVLPENATDKSISFAYDETTLTITDNGDGTYTANSSFIAESNTIRIISSNVNVSKTFDYAVIAP